MKTMISNMLTTCRVLIVALGLMATTGLLQAEEVTLPFKGLTLNANLELAEGRRLEEGVVLIIHGFLSHNRMELVEASQTALLENGQSSLAINVSLGLDNRHGFYDCMIPIRHKLEDALEELDAWLNWLKQKGVRNITLMGHSLSANQILLYTAERKPPEVSGLILLAPNTLGHPGSPDRFVKSHTRNVNGSLARATELIEAGKPEAMMTETDYGFCPQATVTAEAFYSLYQKGTKFWTAHLLLPAVEVPTLVVAAEMDKRQPSTKKHVMPYVDDKRVFFKLIEGSGHFFRDLNIEEAIETAVEFVAETGGAS